MRFRQVEKERGGGRREAFDQATAAPHCLAPFTADKPLNVPTGQTARPGRWGREGRTDVRPSKHRPSSSLACVAACDETCLTLAQEKRVRGLLSQRGEAGGLFIKKRRAFSHSSQVCNNTKRLHHEVGEVADKVVLWFADQNEGNKSLLFLRPTRLSSCFAPALLRLCLPILCMKQRENTTKVKSTSVSKH